MQDTGTSTLETERLLLRQFCHSDADDMFKNWANDPCVTEFLTWPPHENVEVTRNLLDNWISRYKEPEYYNWVIVLKEQNLLVGNISVVKTDKRIYSADIGYCMGKAWWGNGIMPEALRAVIVYLFDETEFNRIAAFHDSNNPESGRVMEKAGMKFEGTLRAAAINMHGIYDKVCYSILRDDYILYKKDKIIFK